MVVARARYSASEELRETVGCFLERHETSEFPRYTEKPDSSSYRRFLGCLIYLTTTRPDISYAVHHLSQFMSAPTSTHSQATFRILRYLKQAPGLGLFFAANSSL